MKTILLLLLFPILVLSCGQESPDCGDPISMNCEILIIDHNDSLLVGKNYHPDSILLYHNEDTIDLWFDNGIVGFIYADKRLDNQDFILYLDYTDQDTITIHLKEVTSHCRTTWLLDTFKFNSHVIQPFTANDYAIYK